MLTLSLVLPVFAAGCALSACAIAPRLYDVVTILWLIIALYASVITGVTL